MRLYRESCGLHGRSAGPSALPRLDPNYRRPMRRAYIHATTRPTEPAHSAGGRGIGLVTSNDTSKSAEFGAGVPVTTASANSVYRPGSTLIVSSNVRSSWL